MSPASPAWVATAMPWVISLFFHLGVAVVLAFAMVLSVVTPPPPIEAAVITNPMNPSDVTVVPSPPHVIINPGREGNPPTGMDFLRQYRDDSLRDLTKHEIVVNADRPGPIISNLSDGSPGLNPVRSTGGGMFVRGILGERGQGGGGGIGQQKLATIDNMIFVIDRSGSMMTDIMPLRFELKKTVRLLTPHQRFALVLFTSGEPREFVYGRMVQADEANKNQFFTYADSIEASGRTDPMPALKRAFALAKSAPKTQYTAICLLTDGLFPDADAAVEFVRQATQDTNIHVFTYLYGSQNQNNDAENMMKRIAHEGKGSYNNVTRE